MHLKNSVIYKSVLLNQQFFVLLYKMHYGTFLQQSGKIRVYEYFDHSN